MVTIASTMFLKIETTFVLKPILDRYYYLFLGATLFIYYTNYITDLRYNCLCHVFSNQYNKRKYRINSVFPPYITPNTDTFSKIDIWLIDFLRRC